MSTAKPIADSRVRWFHSRKFCLRPGDAPELGRASGDSGFVAHLAMSTHGATGWDWSFRLLRKGEGWSFAHDSRLTLFLDEPGQYVPVDAAPGDMVAVRMPRARENLYPNRFTLHGGQGGPIVASGYVKYFIPVRFQEAASLVEAFAGKWADQLRFGLCVMNSPLDYDRVDSAVVDVGVEEEAGVVRLLEAYLKMHPKAFTVRGLPFGTMTGALGLPRALAHGRADLGDGFGWRRSHEGAIEKD